MVKVGLVGLGFMGVTHLKAYRYIPNAQVVAVCETRPLPPDGDLSKIAGNLGDNEPIKLDFNQVKVVTSLPLLLENRDVDLVDLCVPTQDHNPMALAALQAGKHVLCEKPMARTSRLARDMMIAAEVANRILMPAMCLRFWPEWVWVKQAIQDGRFGKTLAARFRRVSEPPSWGRENYFKGAQSGGALLDLHIHDSDFVQFCFGVPSAVYSTGLKNFSGAVDHVVTQYQVAGGVVVHAEGSWIMSVGHGFNMAYTVIFEQATVDYDMARGKDALRVFETGQSPQTIHCPAVNGYAGELEHIITAIQNRVTPTTVTARDGVNSILICEAEERSIQTGQVTQVEAV